MKPVFIYSLLLSALLGAGCVTEVSEETRLLSDSANPEAMTESDPLVLIQRGIEAEKNGRFSEALTAYSALLNPELDVPVPLVHKAVFGRCRALIGLNQYDTALSVLSPLDEYPATLFECQKLAYTARIMALKHKTEEAESFYEIALDNVPKTPETQLFRAEGFAALGKLYLKHRKTDRAARLFAEAQRLFILENRPEQARACRDVLNLITTP